jgi:PKD domain/Carboxypeptidase regulatory-like domain
MFETEPNLWRYFYMLKKLSHSSRSLMATGLLVLALLLLGAGMDAAAQSSIQDAPVTWLFNAKANSDPTNYGQHEPHLAISRRNPDVVVSVAKDYRDGNVKQVWIYVSQDGGLTWPLDLQLQIPGLPIDVPNQSDPIAMARDDGRMYVVSLAYDATGGPGHGLFITWSDDNGNTWHDPSVAITHNETPGGLDDKEWLAIDNSLSSPYHHNMYVAWSDPYGLGILFSRSLDGGETWSPYLDIFPGSGDFTEYAYPIVGPDGTLYVFYMDGWGYCADGYIRYVKSTDGGANFTGPYTVTPTSQPCSPIHGGGFDQFRFFSIITAAVDPTNGNNLWVAWTDDNGITNGKTDVLYVRSTDGGTNWTAHARLSHDDPEAYVDHITPVFSMSVDGRLHAFWIDRRADPANQLWHGYHTSTIDGITWEPDTQVSEVPFDLNLGFPPGSGNAAGDYWGLDTFSNNIVMAAWNTTIINDQQDIYVARGIYTTTAVTLTGQVVDAQSLLPIAGAEVSVDTGVLTTTNGSGFYTMTLDAGIYTVTAQADGYFPQSVPDLQIWYGTVVQDFALQPEVTFTGMVSDISTSAPIVGAEVLLDTGAFTYTNAGGIYTFTLLPGIYTATAQADGYLPETITGIELISGTVTQDFHLLQSAMLTGQVTDADTALPLPGAEISLHTGDFTFTGLTGVYSFTLAPGVYTVTAQAAGYISQTVDSLPIPSGIVVQDFALSPTFCPLPQILDVAVAVNGLAVSFSPTVSATLPVDYLWDFGDGVTSTLPAPIHTYLDYGIYPVTLQVTDACGVATWSSSLELNRFIFLPLLTKIGP